MRGVTPGGDAGGDDPGPAYRPSRAHPAGAERLFGLAERAVAGAGEPRTAGQDDGFQDDEPTWQSLQVYDPATRLRLILALIFPRPAYVRWRYNPDPGVAVAGDYPYRWSSWAWMAWRAWHTGAAGSPASLSQSSPGGISLVDKGVTLDQLEALEPIHVHVEPARGWVPLKLRELWEYRELLYFLTWRDVKIRYKQTVLGASWAILQPFLTMVVFSIFFGKLAQMPSNGIPYPIFSYAALVPWTFFSNGVTQAANSMVNNAAMIKKVYFPRLAIPFAGVFGDLSISVCLSSSCWG